MNEGVSVLAEIPGRVGIRRSPYQRTPFVETAGGLQFTAYQLAVLRGLWDGLTYKEIAGQHGRDIRAVYETKNLLKRKFGTDRTLIMLRRACAAGLVQVRE